jgi:hypothetical protein
MEFSTTVSDSACSRLCILASSPRRLYAIYLATDRAETFAQDSYGPKGAKSGRTKVNIGAVYSSIAPNPLIVVGQTHTPPGSESYPALNDDVSSATHSSPVHDKFTGYNAPGAIEFRWEGNRVNGKGRASAKVSVDKLGVELGEGGLIEKVDVLAEIPYIIRKGLAAVTGTKPYIFQVGLRSSRSRLRSLTPHRSKARTELTVISTSTPLRSTSKSTARPYPSRDGSSTRRRSSPSDQLGTTSVQGSTYSYDIISPV